VHGGTVQDIGQALMENAVYDAVSGQLAGLPHPPRGHAGDAGAHLGGHCRGQAAL
jgi:hypothetical protein